MGRYQYVMDKDEEEWYDGVPINYRELISDTSADGYRDRISQVLIHMMDQLDRIENSNLRILEFLDKNIPTENPWG